MFPYTWLNNSAHEIITVDHKSTELWKVRHLDLVELQRAVFKEQSKVNEIWLLVFRIAFHVLLFRDFIISWRYQKGSLELYLRQIFPLSKNGRFMMISVWICKYFWQKNNIKISLLRLAWLLHKHLMAIMQMFEWHFFQN